jgi:hypothetical protein
MIVRLLKDWAFRLLFFPSVALWLMTIAVFASNGPIHLSAHKDDVWQIAVIGNIAMDCSAASEANGPLRENFRVFVTTPCRALSLSR